MKFEFSRSALVNAVPADFHAVGVPDCVELVMSMTMRIRNADDCPPHVRREIGAWLIVADLDGPKAAVEPERLERLIAAVTDAMVSAFSYRVVEDASGNDGEPTRRLEFFDTGAAVATCKVARAVDLLAWLAHGKAAGPMLDRAEQHFARRLEEMVALFDAKTGKTQGR